MHIKWITPCDLIWYTLYAAVFVVKSYVATESLIFVRGVKRAGHRTRQFCATISQLHFFVRILAGEDKNLLPQIFIFNIVALVFTRIISWTRKNYYYFFKNCYLCRMFKNAESGANMLPLSNVKFYIKLICIDQCYLLGMYIHAIVVVTS